MHVLVCVINYLIKWLYLLNSTVVHSDEAAADIHSQHERTARYYFLLFLSFSLF